MSQTIVLYRIALYCAALYCIVLHCVPYCIVLYCIVSGSAGKSYNMKSPQGSWHAAAEFSLPTSSLLIRPLVAWTTISDPPSSLHLFITFSQRPSRAQWAPRAETVLFNRVLSVCLFVLRIRASCELAARMSCCCICLCFI